MPVSADMAIYKLCISSGRSHTDGNGWWFALQECTQLCCIGCIRVLMDSTGLEEILGATFNGVSNMLNGKAWPKLTRGFRMVVIALLQPFVVSGKTSVDTIQKELDNAKKSRTGRLWVDCLIIPVIPVLHSSST